MSKIVTFARSADYLHQHALSNRRQANMLDALDLMRRALERDPKNVEYQMDLAELLCEMGENAQSNRLLIQTMSLPDAPAECLFGMSCNFSALSQVRASHSAMLRFLARDPESIERGEVSEMLSTLVQRHLSRIGLPRRRARAVGFAERAEQALLQGDLQAGARHLRRSLRLAPDESEPRAMLALCLLKLDDRRGAMRQALASTLERNGNSAPLRARCLAAQVIGSLGHASWAKSQLESMVRRDLQPDERRMLAAAAAELGMHKHALEFSAQALREAPYDIALLHMRAVALVNLGQGQQAARQYWSRVTRIDPSDTVAAYLLAASEKGLLLAAPLRYEYQVPMEEFERRKKHLLGCIQQGDAHVKEQWERSVKFQNLMSWALRSGDGALIGEVVMALGRLANDGAWLMLRELLIRADVEPQQRMRALNALIESGAPRPHLMLSREAQLVDGLLSGGEIHLKPGLRRVLRQIARTQQPREHRGAQPMERFVAEYMRGGRWLPKLRNPAGWAAALTLKHLKLADNPESIKLLCQVFGCNERRLNYRVKRIDSLLGKDETPLEIH